VVDGCHDVVELFEPHRPTLARPSDPCAESMS
jgi:hypothetical protein